MNGTVSRNGSSQFSDAYSCDFKQLDLSNLCRKKLQKSIFSLSRKSQKVSPYFFAESQKVSPYFYEKLLQNRYPLAFM